MKRSEILNKISNVVHEHRRRTESCTSDDLAKIILDLVEENGMLPPETIDPENPSHPENDFINSWEPENETK